jgi:hypothetical protein
MIFSFVFFFDWFMVHDYSFIGSTETSGRNMAVELDSRHPLLPKTGWENEDLTLILRGKR